MKIRVEPNSGFESELNRYYEEHIANDKNEDENKNKNSDEKEEENNINEIKEK